MVTLIKVKPLELSDREGFFDIRTLLQIDEDGWPGTQIARRDKYHV